MDPKVNNTELSDADEEKTQQGPTREKVVAYSVGLTDDEDDDMPYVVRSYGFFRGLVTTIFPDSQVPVWFAINAGVILLYALFNFNAYTIAFESQIKASESEPINYSINVIWCLLFILMGNLLMYFCAMIVRFILLKAIVNLRLSRNAYVFAVISMLDPSLFYLLWSATQSFVWQIFVSRLKGSSNLFCIEAELFSGYVKNHLIFREDALVWISCAVQLNLILAMRSVALSIISFTFELNLLVTSNEALKRYLRLYANIRKFNIDWLELVITRPELVRRIKKAFSSKNVRGPLSPVLESCVTQTSDFHTTYALRILNEAHDTEYMQYFKTKEDLSVPSDSADALVEQSSASAFSNWLLIYYVVRVPPVISLLRQDIALRVRDVIPRCASMLFEQMYFTLIKANQEIQIQQVLRQIEPKKATPEPEQSETEQPDTEQLEKDETETEQETNFDDKSWGRADTRHNSNDDSNANGTNEPPVADSVTVEFPSDVEGNGGDVDGQTTGPEQDVENAYAAGEPVAAQKMDDDTAIDVTTEDNTATDSSGNHPPTVRVSEAQSQPSGGRNSSSYAAGTKQNTRVRNHRVISMLNLHQFRNTLVECQKEGETQPAEDIEPIVTPDYHFDTCKGDDKRYLSAEQMKAFLMPEEFDTIMSLLDLSGHGKINISMLQQTLFNLYSARKKFKNIIRGQDSIFKVLLRLLSFGTWLCAIVAMAFLSGITAEAIVVSGAALLSACTVALSYLYTNFMTSVIFVAISNPYNVGDRVRLNDGEPLTVKKIRTYTTEFVTILGKSLVFQNAVLSTMKITNESRAVRATFDYAFKLDVKTTEEQLVALEDHLADMLNSRPNDFVKDSLQIFYVEVNPGYSLKLSVWITCVESWGNWQRIFRLKGEVMEATMRYCKENGIGYTLPTQPVTFPKQLSLRQTGKRELVPPGKHF
ncbi:Mechanosensitive ion channel protein 10 [Babesia sp. Xinjiang]|uniref:Mechanosensitive ion channel protein 10 n=1 Tax=Babesia sp. Xinjiang TaxID=462227 RepID=UPI000A220703|nr:Mechanosensitive ion channel protein 10 [Babesia sp. Xinjiang]ORM40678.1 Mechanosensitive ion channel protein 10 [Babesia sp. Xinjiang]